MVPEKQTDVGTSLSRHLEVVEALANLNIISASRDEVIDHITKPLDIKTPPEKIKKRPDGYDYVESSFMDYQTKRFMPLYEYKLLHVSWELGWINVIVSLRDKVTGNIELGAGSARIQVSRGIETPGFRDVIDMSNNLKSALTNAIKNAQSRFGISADVYNKRESIPTDDERSRYEAMKIEIYSFSPTRAKMFEEQWNGLGTDWSEFLEKWQVFVDRNKAKKPAVDNQNTNHTTEVKETSKNSKLKL
jgi:hypothetical protein